MEALVAKSYENHPWNIFHGPTLSIQLLKWVYLVKLKFTMLLDYYEVQLVTLRNHQDRVYEETFPHISKMTIFCTCLTSLGSKSVHLTKCSLIVARICFLTSNSSLQGDLVKQFTCTTFTYMITHLDGVYLLGIHCTV